MKRILIALLFVGVLQSGCGRPVNGPEEEAEGRGGRTPTPTYVPVPAPSPSPSPTSTPREEPADSSRLILKYEYGNQVKRSLLVIHESGLYRVHEGTCCPPTYDRKPDGRLSEDELKKLAEAIDKANESEMLEKPGQPSAMGSPSGFLFVYSKFDQVINVRTISPTDAVNGGRDKVLYNTASEARWIESLVDKLVDVDMYR